MKVALAHKRLDLKGGTERDFFRTAEGLRDLGHEVHIFCCEFGVSPVKGTQAHRIPYLALGRTSRLWSFALAGPKVILSHACDVVISFGRMVQQDILRSGGGTHRAFLQKMEQGGKVYRRLWHRVSLYHRSVLAIEHMQYRPQGCRKILAVSREVKREIMSNYDVPQDKISIIYNGVDSERFHPRNRQGARERIRKRWRIPLEAPLVLFVGSGFQRKGLDRLLRAWQSPHLSGAYLLVVGEDAQRGRYRSWTGGWADGRVIFAGRQDDVENYYGAADLLALPARQEAFGNVVLEALASGLPVVVSRMAGAAEVLAGELGQGILAFPDDPLELETKLLRFLDRHRWALISGEARRLGERYSWRNHFLELEKYLIEVAERKRREIPS